MIDYIDSKGEPCNMIDGCTPPVNEQDAYDLLDKNFQRHYSSNRAPFPMFMHASWFVKYPFTLQGMLDYKGRFRMHKQTTLGSM